MLGAFVFVTFSFLSVGNFRGLVILFAAFISIRR